MKKFMVVLAAMAFVIVMVGGAYAAAQESNTLTVQATINGKCSFNTASETIAFPAIDPSETDEKTVSTSGLTYKCTNGTTPQASLDNLSGNKILHSTTANADMIYTLTASPDPLTGGTGFSSSVTATPITITAHLPAASYNDAPAASDYTSTVILTFAY